MTMKTGGRIAIASVGASRHSGCFVWVRLGFAWASQLTTKGRRKRRAFQHSQIIANNNDAISDRKSRRTLAVIS